ncbi:hypothetical protein EIM50_17185 [Pseudoxanthomonas sp. SGD-10]|nr:hypothetical protein EIM50_17185 [Pseudoxanthomonas sp. SGD-10]
MEVAIGDKSAKNFAKPSRPFDVPLNKEAKWNSLGLWDNNTVVAFASTNFMSDQVAPWLIKGYIIPKISFKHTQADYPIFIGAKGNSNLKANIVSDKENLIVESIIRESKRKDSSGVFIYLKLNQQLFKIYCKPNGQKQLWAFDNSSWMPSELLNQVQLTAVNTDNGYSLKLTIPKSFSKAKSLKELRVGMGLSTYNESQDRYIEYLVNMEEDSPETWLNIEL